jgi:hypothetical protein
VFAHSFSSVSAKTTCQAPAGFNLFFFFALNQLTSGHMPAIYESRLCFFGRFRLLGPPAGSTLSSIAFWSNSGLHRLFTSEWLGMRKQFAKTAQWILLLLMASLASCQSGQTGGASGSRTEITDPNTAFSQGGAQPNSSTGPTGGNSSRRGRGLFGGPGGGG